MRIVGLEMENFKRIKVFSLTPKGNVIKIVGGNGEGKTSVLDGIAMALLGTRGGPAVPVRKGAGRGKVSVDLGDYVVTRMWNEGGDTRGEMFIEGKDDGRNFNTPQKLLDNILGKISFDPIAFSRMERAKQREELRKLLGVDEALDELKAKEQVDYQTRRERNNYLTQLEAQRKGIQYPEGLPENKRDIDAMTQELAEVSEFNTNIAREQMQRNQEVRAFDQLQKEIEEGTARVEELRIAIERLTNENASKVIRLKKRQEDLKKLKPLPEPKDAMQLSEDIAAARAINQAIDRRTEAQAKDDEIELTRKDVAKLSRAIERSREDQANIIAKAKFPVPGLSFSEDGVLYNDLPFEQASNAEQIKVSIAVGMANNPKLRVMRIMDGSLLDDKSMAIVEEMAAEHDFQIWMEIVDTSGKVGVYLVDGEIAAIDGQEPPPLKLESPLGPPRKKRQKKDSMTSA